MSGSNDDVVVYNHVISLGSNCHTSNMLQNMGLKMYSCPFDWIPSGIHMIIDCIDTDFSKFLDKSQYIDCSIQNSDPNSTETRAGHKEYSSYLFFHSDPRIEENYQYYIRCVNRWRAVKSTNKPKLYIHMSHVPSRNTKCDDDIVKLSNRISEVTTDYKILAINVIEYSSKSEVVVKKDTPELTIVDMFVKEETNGSKFTHLPDDALLQGIIRRYKYDLIDIT
jgi:hypothetical protein